MKSKKKWIFVIILILIAGIIAAYFLFKDDSGFRFDRKAKKGTLDGMSEKEIQEELDKRANKSGLTISINAEPQFDTGGADGDLRIENPPNNSYVVRVEINKDSDGEEIYSTDGMKPGQLIEKDKLDISLKKGTYPCTATFIAYDEKTLEEVGRSAAKININIRK